MYPVIKRLLDVLFSLACIIILSPLFLILILLLKFTGEGEVFYPQSRVGHKNMNFRMWKFATMLKSSPDLPGGIITVRNDPRITPVGRWLRFSKLNELPQLINILKGEMSFIGPRPLMPLSFNEYTEEVRQYIYQIRPGITGIGSIIFRDEEKMVTETSQDSWEYYRQHIFPLKAKVELWYQQNQSFSTDLILLFLTIWVIFFPNSKLVYSIFRDLPKSS